MKTKVQPAPAGAGGVVDTTTVDPASMSLAPTGTPSPDMAVDMLGPEVNQIVTAIQPLEQVLKDLGLEASQFDTSLDELNVAAAQAHSSVDMAGDGFVNANAQVQSAAFQTDTTLVDLANGASQAATEAKDLAIEAGKAAASQDDQIKSNKDAIDQNHKTTKAGLGAMGMFMALQSALAMIPTEINETDGALKRIGKNATKTALSLVALAFLLQQFGGALSLNSAILQVYSAKKSLQAAAEATSSNLATAGLTRLAGAAASLNAGLLKLEATSMATLGGLAAIALAAYIVMDSFQQMAAEQKKAAIEAGNIQAASAAAMAESGYGTAKVLAVVGVAALALGVILYGIAAPAAFLYAAIVGVGALLLDAFGFLTPVMNAIQNVLSFFTLGLISSTDAVRLRAEADASAAFASERLKEAVESTAEAMKDVESGASTASDALFDNEKSTRAFTSAGEAVNRELKAQAEEAGTDTDDQGLKARKRVIGRFLKERGEEGGVSDATKEMMEDLEIDDAEVKAFQENTQKIFDLIKEEADLRARAAKEMIISGFDRGGDAITQEQFVQEQIGRIPGFDALTQEQQKDVIEDLNKEYENQLKAVIDNIKQLNRFNFGLTETNGAVAMASARIDNLNMAFDSGAATVRKSINKLSAIIEDGATLSPDELQKNLDSINAEFKDFGVDPRSVDNITDQFKALNTVQGSFRLETEKLIAEMKASGQGFGSPEAFTEALKDRLSDVAIAGGADATAVGSLMDSLPELSNDDITALMAGDTSVIADGFGEVNDKLKAALETMAKIASMTEEVAKLNAMKIEAESAFFAAQKTAIDLQLEGAQIQAQYGGKVVKAERLREAALKKANVGISRSGLSALQSGSVEEIRRRNQEIRGGVFGIQNRGRANVAAGGGFFGAGPRVTGAGFSSQGQATEAREKALRQAQQEQISTIKALIAAEEAHLKTIEEKNRLEKESLQSLVDGDVEEFLKKQAAVGATAAIATGDTRLQGIFGAEALGGAFKNLETQQAAGVTELFGQAIGGAGGLLEQSSQAALSARGVTDPRMAALMAGTTAEEEESRQNIRDLAGELGAAGEVGVDIAAQDLQTADFKVQQATIAVQQAMTETQEKSKQAADIREEGQKRANEILARSEAQLQQIEANTAALREEQGANSFAVYDQTNSKLNQKTNTKLNSLTKEQIEANKIAENVFLRRDAGIAKNTGSKATMALFEGRALAKTAASGKGLQQGGLGSGRIQKIGQFFDDIAKGGAAGGSAFTKSLEAGEGFKQAIRAGFRDFSKTSGLNNLASRVASSDVGRNFSIGRRISRMTDRFGVGGMLGGGTGRKATGLAQRAGSIFESTRKMSGEVADLVRKLGQGFAGTKTKGLLVDDIAKPLLNVTKKIGVDLPLAIVKGTGKVGFGAAQAGLGLAAEKTGRFGLNRLAKTNMGRAFNVGRRGFDLAEEFIPMNKVDPSILTDGKLTRGAAGNVQAGRSATFANKVGKGFNKLDKASTALKTAVAGKSAGQITGKAVGLLGKGISKLGAKLPVIGTLISGTAGALEAGAVGESGMGIAGGFLKGALTGSAYAGDSLLTAGLNLIPGVDIERGGAIDKGLGVVGAGAHGALTGAAIGTMIAPGIGTAIGAGVGAVAGMATEVGKILMGFPDQVETAGQVQAQMVQNTGETTEALGDKLSTSGELVSTSLESPVSALEDNRKRRNQIIAASDSIAGVAGAAPISVQAAGGPATAGGGFAPVGAGVGTPVGGVSQDGLMQVMNLFSQNIASFGVEMKRFNDSLANNINELKNLKFKIKLDGPTNVNVNFQNAGFLSQLTEGLKNELLKIVAQELVPQIKHDNAGNHKMGGGTL